MNIFRLVERRQMKKCIEKNNAKLLKVGLIAMRYEMSGNTTELRLNGRVLMIFGVSSKSRAAVDSVTALSCLFRNLNAIDLPKLKEIAFESTLNSF